MPPVPNAALLRKMLGGNRAAKVVVIAGVNHIGMPAATGTFAEYAELGRFDPVVFATFGDWLAARAAP